MRIHNFFYIRLFVIALVIFSLDSFLMISLLLKITKIQNMFLIFCELGRKGSINFPLPFFTKRWKQKYSLKFCVFYPRMVFLIRSHPQKNVLNHSLLIFQLTLKSREAVILHVFLRMVLNWKYPPSFSRHSAHISWCEIQRWYVYYIS